MSLDLNEVVRLLAAGNIPSPRLEARILLEHVGGSPFAEVDGEAEQKLRRLVERRLAHVPLDKLLGRREFYKNDFIVSEDVLTPRPDTEILVEAAVGLVRRNGLKRILIWAPVPAALSSRFWTIVRRPAARPSTNRRRL